MTENQMCPSHVSSTVSSILSKVGFEVYPFKIGWYNEEVKKVFALPYPEDTLAFIVISTPEMFEKAFKPFICRQACTGVRDPIDECMMHQFSLIKQEFPEGEAETIHDFEMHPNRRPKVLVQTAGHVAGAAYYYQASDVKGNPWGDKKIYGVSVHPKYGGWFALRGVIIFRNVLHPDLPRKDPPDVVSTSSLRKELLDRYNNNWQDWSFRDVVPVALKYSEEQKLYFITPPKDRKELIMKIIKQEKVI
ncbi:cyanocobalamin reductase / alkylcobalamin dealkylase-like [Haliotis cracherodii]|uniref:cyanocobalamin reductase / alkylcobalamin dealkylase-like n=1 Tax=Haliotis cracherodii TaxID=6455 RepID=UPI0039EA4276